MYEERKVAHSEERYGICMLQNGKEIFAKHKETILLWGCVVLFGILYISLCFNYNLGVDEAYSIRTFNKDLPELIKRTAGDTHPPLYYFIARAALLVFGEEIPLFKLVPVTFGILTYCLSIWYVKPRFGFQTALFYQFFLFGLPYLTEYMIQIRMYAPLLFFVTWSALCAVEVFIKGSKGNWIRLFVAALCACYTHNYGLLAAFVIYVLLGIFIVGQDKKKLIPWLFSGIGIAVCFFPWLLILLHQMRNMPEHFMAQPITGKLLLEIMTQLFASGISGTAYMFWGLIVLSCIMCTKAIKKDKVTAIAALNMFGVFVLTFVLGVILSLIITPLLMARYMVSCLGVLALFLAFGLTGCGTVPNVLLAAFVLAVGVQSYMTNFSMEYLQHKSNATVAYFKDHLTDRDIVVYNSEGTRWVYECYFDDSQLVFLRDCDFAGDYETIYFIDSCCEPWLSDEVLESNGWQKIYEGNYGIEFNDFMIYRLERTAQ